MKKILTALLFLALVFTLAACNGEEEEPPPTELDTRLTNALRLDRDYEGKDFFTDGIAEATLSSCIDGDTSRFHVSGRTVTVRYLAVDTPESTGSVEPWGHAASEFVCDRLSGASTIVLEAETPDETGNYGRHLAYIWYDDRLLNLELIELAYSYAQGVGGLKYADEMREAEDKARPTGLRIWGEDDPSFVAEPQEITLAELTQNRDDYLGVFINLEGYVSRTEGANFYLVDENGENEVYVYGAHNTTSKIEVGYKVRIEELYGTTWHGRFQLTNFDPRRTDVLEIN